MRKQKIPVPKPRSSFLLIQCTNCGAERTVFSSVTIDVRCKVCDSLLAEKRGGRAKLHGAPVRRLD